jgi:hypothetical protein
MPYQDMKYKGYLIISDKHDEFRHYASVELDNDTGEIVFTSLSPSQREAIQMCKRWVDRNPVTKESRYANRCRKKVTVYKRKTSRTGFDCPYRGCGYHSKTRKTMFAHIRKYGHQYYGRNY